MRKKSHKDSSVKVWAWKWAHSSQARPGEHWRALCWKSLKSLEDQPRHENPLKSHHPHCLILAQSLWVCGTWLGTHVTTVEWIMFENVAGCPWDINLDLHPHSWSIVHDARKFTCDIHNAINAVCLCCTWVTTPVNGIPMHCWCSIHRCWVSKKQE